MRKYDGQIDLTGGKLTQKKVLLVRHQQKLERDRKYQRKDWKCGGPNLTAPDVTWPYQRCLPTEAPDLSHLLRETRIEVSSEAKAKIWHKNNEWLKGTKTRIKDFKNNK